MNHGLKPTLLSGLTGAVARTDRFQTFLDRVARWWLARRTATRPAPDWREENHQRIARLRARGVRIGEECWVLTEAFSTEPYLVELGRHVAVAGGVQFITHDGSVWLRREQRPEVQHFGRIVVGDNTFIGHEAIVLPGTTLGRDCIVGAGSVVRGEIPDNSLVIGNPGRIVGRASLALERMLLGETTLDSFNWSAERRREVLEQLLCAPPAPPAAPAKPETS